MQLCASVCACVFVHRSGQLIEPLYQVWEELADAELGPTQRGRQVRRQESSGEGLAAELTVSMVSQGCFRIVPVVPHSVWLLSRV